MNLWILFALISNLFVLSIRSISNPNPSEDPLIFNPRTVHLYELDDIDSSSQSDFGPFAVACPTNNEAEREFNRKISLDDKALLVREFFSKGEPGLYQTKCSYAYQMAVVYHDKANYGKILEFGYEIYYRKNQVEKKFILNNHDSGAFGRAEELNSRMLRIYELYHRKFLDDEDNVDIAQKFVFISKVMLRYRYSRWSFKWVSYSMNFRIDQLQVKCKNYNLGIRLYNLDVGHKLEDFYSSSNQKSIFDQVVLPKSIDGVCKTQKKCVVQYNLVAPYYFQTYISKLIECSHLTSIPIWYKRTKELLDHSEKFIIALAQTVGNRIDVLTGLHNTLNFPQNYQKQPKSIPIYLDSENNRIPVPEIIYKLVTTKIANCDPKKSTCEFGVVIVIHNEPEVNHKEKLCSDTCEKWGWQNIQYLSTTTDKKEISQFIYCCELDKKLKKKLAYSGPPIYYGVIREMFRKTSGVGIMDLKNFENCREKNGSTNRVCPNVQPHIEEKMNVLFDTN